MTDNTKNVLMKLQAAKREIEEAEELLVLSPESADEIKNYGGTD